jgi:hypothetical protein
LNSPIGQNQRFINRDLFLGTKLHEQGFGPGEQGLAAAKKAAENTAGSELIFQDASGHWQAQTVGEAKNAQAPLKPLSEIDQAEIVLNPVAFKQKQIHSAFVSFADQLPEKELPVSLNQLSPWQKLAQGNLQVGKNVFHKATLALSHPVRTASDLATGLVSNTYSTLKNPTQAWEHVETRFQADPVEGVIAGVRSFGAVVASAALVTGAAAAVVSTGSTLTSFKMARSLTTLPADATLEMVVPMLKRAQTVSVIGLQAGRVGMAAGQVGKYAGGTLLAATAASWLKNQYDLSQSQTPAQMRHEIQQLTQDTASLAQSAAFVVVNDLFQDIAKIAKRLYTENRNYPSLSPEANHLLDQFIAEKSQNIAKRAQAEIPDLHPQKWEKLGLEQKQQVLQSLNKVIGEELNFQPAPLEVKDLGADLSGGYFFDQHQVALNTRILGSSSDLINTLTHEQFHAFQSLLVKTFQEQNKHSQPLLQAHIDAWRANRQNYASPMNTPSIGKPGQEMISRDALGLVFPGMDNIIEYKSQPLEKSAWAIGDATEKAFKQINQP